MKHKPKIRKCSCGQVHVDREGTKKCTRCRKSAPLIRREVRAYGEAR